MEYTDKDIGEIKLIEDFLPPPEKLVLKEKTIKITLTLDSRTIRFFKAQADLHHGQYQKMIRALLDQYVAQCLIKEHKAKKKKRRRV